MLPPLIGVAGFVTVSVTLPDGPAVGVLPPKSSLSKILPVEVWVVAPLAIVIVSLTTVRLAAPTVTTTVVVPVQLVGFNTSQ